MTTISTLPDAPSRTDPATFSAKSDALLGALATFVSQTNTVAGEVNANAATATTQAGLATTNGAAQVSLAAAQADLATTNGAAQVSLAAAQVSLAAAQVSLATTQATNAANSATAAASSALVAGAVAWVSGTTYAIGDTRYSPINFQTYRRKTNGAGTTDPSQDQTNWANALDGAKISTVTTATTATALTNTPTFLKITPASHGVAVTLPDATTCSVGGPLHIIENRGVYPVRVLNSDGKLIGFVCGGVVSHVSLSDKSLAAGVWSIGNAELAAESAQMIASNLTFIDSVIDIGSNKELVIGRGLSGGNCYAFVYDSAANVSGNETLVRTATFGFNLISAISAGVGKVLVVSCATAATTFEAVVLSISGTTITVNTAATATLSANISSFTDGCGLIACNGSFVTSYTVSTPAAQIRSVSVSGTTATIGSATVLDGTAGGLIAASASGVIAASTATTHLYTKYYGISGSTITAGTGTDTNSGTMTLNKLSALGTRWYCGYNDGGSTVKGGVVSLSGTATSISAVTLFASGTLTDAIVVGNSKVLAFNDKTTNHANIMTDTAGTASAGTAITLDGETSRVAIYVTGTTVIAQSCSSFFDTVTIDCSGSSPVAMKKQRLWTTAVSSSFGSSNSVLSRSASGIYGAEFAQTTAARINPTNSAFSTRVLYGATSTVTPFNMNAGQVDRGAKDSIRWSVVTPPVSTNFVVTKLECVE